MPIEYADKIYQAVAFAGLIFPVAFFRPPWLMMVIPIFAAFGGVIGLLQPYVGRECSLQDWWQILSVLPWALLRGLQQQTCGSA